MSSLNTNVRSAGLNSSWKWYLKNLTPPDKPVKVFSTFSCGGGSTMGYKLAGFEVIGNVELDVAMNRMYVKNHHPRHNYNIDLRDFNKLTDLPEELYHLDILDGSPPCSTFSMAGLREKSWGIEKRFREGQKKQRLDDLFFVYLDTVKKLKPKVTIAENVSGILKGKAKGYINEILKIFAELGYDVQIFQLNSAVMEVPQSRERVFFIANNQGYPKLKLNYHYPLIPFGAVRTAEGIPFQNENSLYKKLLEQARPQDKKIADVRARLGMRKNGFIHSIVSDNDVCPCSLAGGCKFRLYDGKYFSSGDYINVQTFPQDYDFCGNDVQYVCGMSVPPLMMKNIALDVYKQWLKGALEHGDSTQENSGISPCPI